MSSVISTFPSGLYPVFVNPTLKFHCVDIGLLSLFPFCFFPFSPEPIQFNLNFALSVAGKSNFY